MAATVTMAPSAARGDTPELLEEYRWLRNVGHGGPPAANRGMTRVLVAWPCRALHYHNA